MKRYRKTPIIKIISVALAIIFTMNTVSYGLATLPASQNIAVKAKISAALQRTKVLYAESEYAKKLLKNNGNADCLLLSSGTYLVSKEVADNDIELLRSIVHEDVEALLQILADEYKKGKNNKYRSIRELILNEFSPDESNTLPLELYVNHTVARAFEWLVLLADDIINEDQVPEEEMAFLRKIAPSILLRKHNIFTSEFWDVVERGKKIQEARNDGMRFYKVANADGNKTSEQPRIPSASESRLKILLVASDSYEHTLSELNKNWGIFAAPPFGLYRMKAYLEKNKIADVDIFDPNLYDDDMRDRLTEMVQRGSYDICGFSLTHVNLQSDITNIDTVKSAVANMGSLGKVPVLLAGGQEATHNYEKLLEIVPVDAIILGYGELVLRDIVKNMQSEKDLSQVFTGVKGVAYLSDTELLQNLPKKLNATPVTENNFRSFAYTNDPSHLIPYEEYWKRSERMYTKDNMRIRAATLRTVRMFTSSHCPNGCGFCSSTNFLQASSNQTVQVQFISAEQVVDLVKKNVMKHAPEAIYFNDDDFIINRSNGRARTLSFCKMIIKEKNEGGLPKDLQFYTQTKVRCIIRKDAQGRVTSDTELLEAMKKAGFVLIALGVESFSDRLLKAPSINKKITSEDAKAAIEGVLSAGITPLINLILMPPEVEEQDIVDTIKESVKYIRMGAQASPGFFIENYSGAEVTKLGYPSVKKAINVPGMPSLDYKVTTELRPVDEDMHKIAKAVPAKYDEIIRDLEKHPNWNFKRPPQILSTVIQFMAILSLLEGRDEELRNVELLADQIIKSNRPKVLLIPSWEIHVQKGMFGGPSLGLYRIKKHLEKTKTADVEIFDSSLYSDPEEALKMELAREKYDMIGFSPTYVNMQEDLSLIWRIKDIVSRIYPNEPLLIAGGQDATINSETWLKNAPLDLVVNGYGETVLGELLEKYEPGRKEALRKDLDTVKGVTYIDNDGRLKRNRAVELDEKTFRDITFGSDPLNEIPYERYWEIIGGTFGKENLKARGATLRTIRLFTSSHCPGGCGFCSSQSFLPEAFGKKTPIHYISAQEVFELLKRGVVTHGAEAVFFNDDNFLLGNKAGEERAIEFCGLVKEAKKMGELPYNLRLIVQVRVKDITRAKSQGGYAPKKKLLEAMQEAGFDIVGLGVESFSDKLLSSPSINKGISSDRSRSAIQGIFDAGMKPLVDFILMPPESKKEDLIMNLEEVMNYLRAGAQVNLEPLIEAYPGAPLWNQDLPTSKKTISIEDKGIKFDIKKDYYPQDPEMYKVALGIRGKCDEILERLKKNPDWTLEYPPKFVVMLTYVSAAFELMGMTEKADEAYKMIWEMAEEHEKAKIVDEAAVEESTKELLNVMSRMDVGGEELLRIHILDNNVFFENRYDFDFLPVTAGEDVSKFMKKTGAMSIVIAPSMIFRSPKACEYYVKKLMHYISSDNLGGVLSLMRNDMDSGMRVEIFSAERGKTLPKGVSLMIWQGHAKDMFRGRDKIYVGGHQPGYHRYIGFFNKLKKSDIFIFANDMQFVKREWQNRQEILSANGEKKWLTVPKVGANEHQTIFEKRIFNDKTSKHYWARKHWLAIQETYGDMPFFEKYAPFFEKLYSRDWENLDALNEAITRYLAKELGVHETELIRSTSIGNDPDSTKAKRIVSEINKVLDGVVDKETCQPVYLSGRDASYLENISPEGVREKELILREGVEIEEQQMEEEKMKERYGIDIHQSAAAFLFQLGPQARGAVVSLKESDAYMHAYNRLQLAASILWKRIRKLETKQTALTGDERAEMILSIERLAMVLKASEEVHEYIRVKGRGPPYVVVAGDKELTGAQEIYIKQVKRGIRIIVAGPYAVEISQKIRKIFVDEGKEDQASNIITLEPDKDVVDATRGLEYMFIPQREFENMDDRELIELGKHEVPHTAFVIMAGGKGTRAKDILTMSEKAKEKLGLEDIGLEQLQDEYKQTYPLSWISNKGALVLNMETISSMVRDTGAERPSPVIISLGVGVSAPMARAVRAFDASRLNVILTPEVGQLPVIDGRGKTIEMEPGGDLLISGGGTGSPFKGLENKMLSHNKFNAHEDHTILEWLRTQQIRNVVFISGDTVLRREALYAILGARAKNRTSLSVAAYNNPLRVNDDGILKDQEHRDFMAYENLGKKNKRLKKFGIVVSEDRPPKLEKQLASAVRSKRFIPVFTGNFAITLDALEKSMGDPRFRHYIHKGKKETLSGGEIVTVNKIETAFVEPLEDIPDFTIVTMDQSEAIGAKTAISRSMARKVLLERDKRSAHELGIEEIADTAIVEISPLCSFDSIGRDVKIRGNAKVYFGSESNKESTISIGNNVIFEGDIVVRFKGGDSIVIPDNVVFNGTGEIVIGNVPGGIMGIKGGTPLVPQLIQPILMKVDEPRLPVFSIAEGDVKNCTICGEARYEAYGKIILNEEELELVRCKKDGMIWMRTQPPNNLREKLFSDMSFYNISTSGEYQEYDDADEEKRVTAMERINEIVKIRRGGKFLGVGAAREYMLEEARTRGWDVQAVEISDYAVDMLEQKQIPVFKGTLSDAGFEDDQFDVVMLNQVIELSREPGELLEEVKCILNDKHGDEGILAINVTTVDLDNRPIQSVELLHYFTPKTLRELLEKKGFDVLQIEEASLASGSKIRTITVLAKVKVQHSYSFAKRLGKLIMGPLLRRDKPEKELKARDIMDMSRKERLNIALEYSDEEEDRDYGRNHVERVSRIAEILAEKLGLSEEQKRILITAAEAHDGGYMNLKIFTQIAPYINIGYSNIDEIPRRFNNLHELILYLESNKGGELTMSERRSAEELFDHGQRVVGDMERLNIKIPSEIEYLIRYHANFMRFKDNISSYEGGTLSAEELELLMIIHLAADHFENYNDVSKSKVVKHKHMIYTFKEFFASMPEVFHIWEEGQGEVLNALKDLIKTRDSRLFEIVAEARGTSELPEEDENFIIDGTVDAPETKRPHQVSKLLSLKSTPKSAIQEVKTALRELMGTPLHEDLHALIDMYEGRFFEDEEVTAIVRDYRDVILRGINNIIYDYIEVRNRQFTSGDMQRFRELAKSLEKDTTLEEAQRMQALLNFLFGIKFQVLKDNYLLNEEIVDIVPYGPTASTPWEVGDEFKGKKVLVFEEHHDDAAFFAGAIIGDNISIVAKSISLVTVISDPLGVTDEFARMKHQSLGDGEKIPDNLKQSIRENEGKLAAERMGIHDCLDLRIPREIEEVRHSRDCINSYYMRVHFDFPKLIENLRNILEKKDPDSVIFGVPRGYHQEHRDVSRALLTVMREHNKERKKLGKEPVTLYLYPHAGIYGEFVANDIKPNIVYNFGEREQKNKQEMVKKFESQIDRKPEYPIRLMRLDADRAELCRGDEAGSLPYAEALLRVKLETEDEQKVAEQVYEQEEDMADEDPLKDVEVQITEHSKEIKDIFDTESVVVLWFDLLRTIFEKKRNYEIRYDTDQLSDLQIGLLEEYINLLRKKTAGKVKGHPFSGKRARSKKPLITVLCKGRGFSGEGHVDVNVEEGDLSEYLLRITGVVNIALAASNIPEDVTQAELKTIYGPLIGFIRRQYKDILGEDIKLPKGKKGLIKAIRHIVLTLPKAYKLPEKIKEYYVMARKMLVSA